MSSRDSVDFHFDLFKECLCSHSSKFFSQFDLMLVCDASFFRMDIKSCCVLIFLYNVDLSVAG